MRGLSIFSRARSTCEGEIHLQRRSLIRVGNTEYQERFSGSEYNLVYLPTCAHNMAQAVVFTQNVPLDVANSLRRRVRGGFSPPSLAYL